MKKILSIILYLPVVAYMLAGCAQQQSTKIEEPTIKEGEMRITELKVAADSCITPVGELVAVGDVEQWCKFFSRQQCEALAIDFTQNSVLIVTERSQGGVYAVTQKLSYSNASGYVLENNVVQDYTTQPCTWMRVVLTPLLSPKAKISSKTTYIKYGETIKDGVVESRQIDLMDDPATITLPQNPCIIRTKEELKRYLPLQNTDIDLLNHSLILVTSSTAYQIKSIEHKVILDKSGKVKLEVTLLTSDVAKTTPWATLVETPRLPMGYNPELEIKYFGQNSKPVEFTKLDFEDVYQNYDLLYKKGVKPNTPYVFYSLAGLNECLPEQVASGYQDIDFAKHSAIFVHGNTPYSDIRSIDQKLTYVEGFGYVYHITVDCPGGAMTPDNWATMILTPLIDKDAKVAVDIKTINGA